MPGKAENPYSALLRLMRAQGAANNPPSWGVGEVTQLAPVKILFRGIVLEPSQLFWLHGFSDSQLQIAWLLPPGTPITGRMAAVPKSPMAI